MALISALLFKRIGPHENHQATQFIFGYGKF
jgi:hypothetical protein